MKEKKNPILIVQSTCKIVSRDIKNNRIQVIGKGVLIDPRDKEVEVEVEDEILQLDGYKFAQYAQIR